MEILGFNIHPFGAVDVIASVLFVIFSVVVVNQISLAIRHFTERRIDRKGVIYFTHNGKAPRLPPEDVRRQLNEEISRMVRAPRNAGTQQEEEFQRKELEVATANSK